MQLSNMSLNASQPSLIKKKRRPLLPLPDPCFKKPKLTAEEEVIDIIPLPDIKQSTKENYNSDQPAKIISGNDSISLSITPPIRFIYQKKELLCQFKCHYNFSGRTVFLITQNKTVDEILKLKLSCKDLEHCVKLTSLGDSEDMSIFDNVCIIENAMNDVYIIFHNENQFDWGSYSTCENEYLMYKVVNTDKIHLLINRQYIPIIKNEPLCLFQSNKSSSEDKSALSLFEYKSVYKKLANLKIEVPIEKKRFEDRLLIQTEKLNRLEQKINQSENKAKYEKFNQEIINSERQLNNTRTLFNQMQLENEQMKKRIESQEDIYDKLTRSVIEAKQSYENEQKMKEELILQQQEVRNRLSDLKEEINRKNEEKDRIKNKTTYMNIDGRVFEEIGKEDNTNKDYECKLAELENQYEGCLCSLCMINQRDCLFAKCKHLFCCKSCVSNEINKSNKRKKKKTRDNKNETQIKGKMACPYCNEINIKFVIISLK